MCSLGLRPLEMLLSREAQEQAETLMMQEEVVIWSSCDYGHVEFTPWSDKRLGGRRRKEWGSSTVPVLHYSGGELAVLPQMSAIEDLVHMRTKLLKWFSAF